MSQEATTLQLEKVLITRRTQSYLKPYQLQSKKLDAECSVFQPIEQSSNIQTLKHFDHRNSDSMNNQVQSYSRPKRVI